MWKIAVDFDGESLRISPEGKAKRKQRNVAENHSIVSLDFPLLAFDDALPLDIDDHYRDDVARMTFSVVGSVVLA